jgi:hypothetical protein
MNLRPIIERRIADAQDEGKFRDLQGEGKPQDLEENPFEPPEWRVGFKVLRNAGYVPAWIELAREIDAELAAAEREAAEYARRRRARMDRVGRESVARFGELVADLDISQERALRRLEGRWQEINRKIARFNSEVPVEGLKRAPLRIEERRERFERDFPRLRGLLSAG